MHRHSVSSTTMIRKTQRYFLPIVRHLRFVKQNTFTETGIRNILLNLGLPGLIVDEACKAVALSLDDSSAVTTTGFETFRIAAVIKISNPGRINFGIYIAYVLKNKKMASFRSEKKGLKQYPDPELVETNMLLDRCSVAITR